MTSSSLPAPLTIRRKLISFSGSKSYIKGTIALYVLLIIVYLALVWFLPPNRSSLDKYSLNELQAKLLNLTFVFPLIGVWISALYGYLKFRAYALIIKDTPEGRPFNRLADGLLVLAFGLPLTAIMSALFNFYSARHPEWLTVSTIIRNYIDLIVYFIAFTLLFHGARGLYTALRPKTLLSPGATKYTTVVTVAVSTVFTWLLLANPLNPADVSGRSIYQLPNWLIVSTIAIPYLLSWYYGAMASYWLLAYRRQVSGKVYKQPFGDLAKGIAVIVFDAVFIRFITSLSPRLERLNLTPILLIIYGLVLLYILGYGLVARGAKGLKKIEEV